jgi:hypothetical protein
MTDREKTVKGLEFCTQHGSMCGNDCNGHYERYTDDGYVIKLVNEYRSKCPYGKCETGCVKTLAKDALELLKEQEPIKPDKEKIMDCFSYFVEVYHCGKCGKDVTGCNYCPNCGRKVKWK